MRNVFIIGAIACLSACATVTVKPASITTSFVAEDSSLTKSAKAYKTQIENAGWVQKTSAFSFLQSKLFDTGEDAAKPAETYADKVSAKGRSPEKMISMVVSDIRSARIGLYNLNMEARSALSGDDALTRKDVVAYEDALVIARQARQSFSGAVDVIMEKSPLIAADVTTALKAFGAEIDVSRQLADDITKSWKGSNTDMS